jgi:hypothetical protein
MLSFNTGRSMSSWAGQDLTVSLSMRGTTTDMAIGGRLARSNFGGGQLFSWGEKGRLSDQFAQVVRDTLPSTPEPKPAAPPASPAPAASTSTSVADELTKLAALRDSGVLTEDEFAVQKARLLGS